MPPQTQRGQAHQRLSAAIGEALAEGRPVPCVTGPLPRRLWTSDNPDEAEAAGRACLACAALSECATAGNNETAAVWAGRGRVLAASGLHGRWADVVPVEPVQPEPDQPPRITAGDEIALWLSTGPATAGELAQVTGRPPQTVASALRARRFVQVGRRGRSAVWALAEAGAGGRAA